MSGDKHKERHYSGWAVENRGVGKDDGVGTPGGLGPGVLCPGGPGRLIYNKVLNLRSPTDLIVTGICLLTLK